MSDFAENVDIISEINNIQPSEEPAENTNELDQNHFDSEDFQEEIQEEPIPQMSSAEYRALAKSIVNACDVGFVTFIDNKVYFTKYCGNIPAAILIECEKLFNQEIEYKNGSATQFQTPSIEIQDHYTAYKAYRKKIDRIKLSNDEIKSIAEPLSKLIKQKSPELSPTNALLLAVGLVYIPRGIEAFTEKQ